MIKRKKMLNPREKMSYTRIYLWRHPEATGQMEGQFWGSTDVSLSKRGKLQMQAVVRRMSVVKLKAIYSSDLQRTRSVADAVGRVQKPRRKSDALTALRELNLGEWEGLTYQDVESKYPGALTARGSDLVNYKIPGGESLQDLADRVMPAFQQIVGDNKGGEICIVAHAGVNRVILTKIMGAPLDRVFRLEQEYASLNLIDVYEDGIPLIKGVNLPAEVVAE